MLPVQYKLSWMTEAVLSGSSCETKTKISIIWLKWLVLCTPFAVHYEKIRNHLRETATSCAKIHSLARKYAHLRINQIQLRFLHFNQHSITLLGIHMGHWAYKREKYTFINANIKVINTILKVNRDNWHTLKCKHYSLTFLWHSLQFNSIPGQPFLDAKWMCKSFRHFLRQTCLINCGIKFSSCTLLFFRVSLIHFSGTLLSSVLTT